MAKRKTSTASIVRYMPPRPQAQIIKVSAPRAAAKPKKHHRRKHGSAGGALSQSRMVEFAVGGAAYGFITKQFGAQIPTLPVIGRSGTIAIAAYWFGKGKGGIMRDIAIAAAVIAGYEIGTTGKVQGDGVMGDGVMGIASQM